MCTVIFLTQANGGGKCILAARIGDAGVLPARVFTIGTLPV